MKKFVFYISQDGDSELNLMLNGKQVGDFITFYPHFLNEMHPNSQPQVCWSYANVNIAEGDSVLADIAGQNGEYELSLVVDKHKMDDFFKCSFDDFIGDNIVIKYKGQIVAREDI